MKITERDLMVARAVRDECWDKWGQHKEVDLTALLESLPEPMDELIAAMKPWPPAPAEQAAPAAWLVRGGRVYRDRAMISEEVARSDAARRGDGSVVVPLYFGRPAEQEQAAQDAGQDDAAAEMYRKGWETGHAAGLAEGARAERERCARIARDYGRSFGALRDPANVRMDTGDAIAEAIRAAQDEPGGKGEACRCDGDADEHEPGCPLDGGKGE